MAFDFPSSPAVGDTFEEGGIKYTWSGTAWDLFTAGSAGDFVLKAGDVMTGPLGFSTADFNISANVNFDFNIPLGVAYKFYIDGTEKTRINADGLATQGHVRAQGGGAFAFSNTDNNAWQNAFYMNGGIMLQYHQGGNNDGRLRIWTSNGGYTDTWVMETTIVSGAPGIIVNGNMSAGSITCRGGHINATNVDGYGIAFYSGAIIYKSVGSGMILRKHTGGTQWQIENNDGSGRVNVATSTLVRNVEDQIGDAVAPLLKLVQELRAEVDALKKVRR